MLTRNADTAGLAGAKFAWAVTLLLGLPAMALSQPQIAIGGYALPTAYSYSYGITPGPDGALWFTESGGYKIGRITTAGTITEYSVPTPHSRPEGIALGPDGALWFAEYDSDQIGRVTTGGVFTEYLVPGGPASCPFGIVAGPDGALWFTEFNGDIGRVTTAGVFTSYTAGSFSSDPLGITAGPDGALWFTQYFAGIGRITTAGVYSAYTVPTANSNPFGITPGPDGALWFTESAGNKIGRITTIGAFTEYPVPTANSSPGGITPGPDGALWFTESASNKIGRITTAGAITEYPVPIIGGLAASPGQITTGPDGELWFTNQNGNSIGQAVFVTATLAVSPASGSFDTKLTFTGSAFAPGESVLIYTSGVGSAVLTSATANPSGSFTATGRAPQSAYGTRLFLGVGQSSGKLGAASFSIKPKLVLMPASGPVGSTVTAEGYGFGALEQVKIAWSNPPTILGEPTANVRGSFTRSGSLTFQVPAGSPAGPIKVSATGQSSGAKTYASFTVE